MAELSTPAPKGAPPRAKRAPRKSPKHAVQFIVWTMNGEPMPEAVQRGIEDAVQREMEKSRVRLLSTTVKV